MRGFDLWQNDREKATIDETGIKILRGDNLSLRMWRPKAINPFAHFRFRNEAERESYIQAQIQNFKANKARIKEYKNDRNGKPEDLAKLKIGDIYHWSWGYDQTNCNFYQVIEIHGRILKLREIAQKTVEGSESFMSDSRLAVPNAFLENQPTLTKKVQFSHGKPYISMEYGWCDLWEGKPEQCSWYA